MPSSECVPPLIHIPDLSVVATPFHRSYALMKNLISLWRSGLSYCYQRSESCSLHHVGYPVNRNVGINIDIVFFYLVAQLVTVMARPKDVISRAYRTHQLV